MGWMIVIFWLAAGLLAYAYVLYPVLLWQRYVWVQVRRDWEYLRHRTDRRAREWADDELPPISIVIPAYNEQAHLAAKLANLREVDYPPEKLEVVFVSDGSTDATNVILRAHAAGCTVIALPQRGGKARAINLGIARARHEVVVLCDAATQVEPGAIRKLVRHFRDPRVGVACGALQFDATPDSKATEGVYWRYECLLRLMEARLGATLTASGAFYALRRACFRPLPSNTLLDDFVVPMAVRAQGYKVVFDPEARAMDFAAASVEGEFRRRVRLAVGSFRALASLLRVPADGWTRWAFLSHKVLRWFVPLFLCGLLISNVVLATRPLYAVALALQGLFYALAVLGWRRGQGRRVLRPARLAYYLLAMHAAFAVGMFRAVFGRDEVIWQRVQ